MSKGNPFDSPYAAMSFPRFNATGLTKYQTLTRIFVQALPRLDTLFAANEFIYKGTVHIGA